MDTKIIEAGKKMIAGAIIRDMAVIVNQAACHGIKVCKCHESLYITLYDEITNDETVCSLERSERETLNKFLVGLKPDEIMLRVMRFLDAR